MNRYKPLSKPVSTHPFVFVVEGGELRRREVRVTARDESRGVVAVSAGLEAGEQVLVAPTPDVTAGTPVRLASERPPLTPGAPVEE